MSTAPVMKRLMKEHRDFREKPTREFLAYPLESNLLEWHFTMRGPPDSPFSEGFYHGKIIVPINYPFSPPDCVLLTPNGRFELNKIICLSVSSYHPETWRSAWGLQMVLFALRQFMTTPGNNGIGAIEYPADVRRELAQKSHSFECAVCGHKVADDKLRMDTFPEATPMTPPILPTPAPTTTPGAAGAATTPSSQQSTPLCPAATEDTDGGGGMGGMVTSGMALSASSVGASPLSPPAVPTPAVVGTPPTAAGAHHHHGRSAFAATPSLPGHGDDAMEPLPPADRNDDDDDDADDRVHVRRGKKNEKRNQPRPDGPLSSESDEDSDKAAETRRRGSAGNHDGKGDLPAAAEDGAAPGVANNNNGVAAAVVAQPAAPPVAAAAPVPPRVGVAVRRGGIEIDVPISEIDRILAILLAILALLLMKKMVFDVPRPHTNAGRWARMLFSALFSSKSTEDYLLGDEWINP